MRTKLDNEMTKLHQDFKEMLLMTIQSLIRTKEAFCTKNKQLTQNIMDDDVKINDMETQIELSCGIILALQQPVINELRYVLSILKSCSDIERMADHTSSIAKNIQLLMNSEHNLQIESAIDAMFIDVIDMLQALYDTLDHLEESSARDIAKMDNVVDAQRDTIRRLIMQQMQQQHEQVISGSYYMQMITHLERIADYVTNVCERIIYIQTHQIVDLNI